MEILTVQTDALVPSSCLKNFQMPLLWLALLPLDQARQSVEGVLTGLVLPLKQPWVHLWPRTAKVLEVPLLLARHH